jgi:hypothetical protein
VVLDAMRGAGLDVEEQAIPGVGGANLIARVPGRVDRWVMVAAHYDHLGKMGGQIYRGADDNAASVAIMVEVARRLVQKRADGRGVIFAAFDAEEPPFFLTSQMGSEVFCRENRVEAIDMMVCLELVGHSLGAEGMPAGVRESLFALGAERSEGTAAVLEGVTVNGVEVRRADAEIIPPLSDYAAFWERERPFLLLTGGRGGRAGLGEDGGGGGMVGAVRQADVREGRGDGVQGEAG